MLKVSKEARKWNKKIWVHYNRHSS